MSPKHPLLRGPGSCRRWPVSPLVGTTAPFFPGGPGLGCSTIRSGVQVEGRAGRSSSEPPHPPPTSRDDTIPTCHLGTPGRVGDSVWTHSDGLVGCWFGLEMTCQAFDLSPTALSGFTIPSEAGLNPRRTIHRQGAWTPPSHLLGPNRSDEAARARQSLIILGFIEMHREPSLVLYVLNLTTVMYSNHSEFI